MSRGIKSVILSVGWIFSVICGCTLNHAYLPPKASIPTSWSMQGKIYTHAKYAQHELWWHNFHDPLLSDLLEHNAMNNLDIKIAQARVATANAEYAIAIAQFFPQIGGTALPPNGTGLDTLTQVVALTASIEPDFFGRLSGKRKYTAANLAALKAIQNFSLFNLQAAVAGAYMELRETQAINKILQHNLRANTQVLNLLKSSYKSGLTNYLDIAQQESLLEVQLADLERNQSVITAILHKIEGLTGNNPGVLSKKLLAYKPIPTIAQSINLNTPATLLRRRQDIIAAERRVAATHANIDISISHLFPKITLGWLLGWQTKTIASSIFALQNADSTFFGLFDAPIINLALHKIVTMREREQAIAVIQYQKTVLQALHDVAIQYNYYQHYQASAMHLKKATDHKRTVLLLAKDTYRKGVTNFNTVLQAETDLNNLEISWVHTLAMQQIAVINLYKALGGGPAIQANKKH